LVLQPPAAFILALVCVTFADDIDYRAEEEDSLHLYLLPNQLFTTRLRELQLADLHLSSGFDIRGINIWIS
jgi:hypothetical protein